MKYIKKPVVIEAVQWNGDNLEEIREFSGMTLNIRPHTLLLEIPTLEGVMEAKMGDYIIKGVAGEIYPCKPDIFKQTYAETEGDTNEFEMDLEILELIKQYISTSFSGAITIDCKLRNPVAYQQILSWIQKIRNIKKG